MSFLTEHALGQPVATTILIVALLALIALVASRLMLPGGRSRTDAGARADDARDDAVDTDAVGADADAPDAAAADAPAADRGRDRITLGLEPIELAEAVDLDDEVDSDATPAGLQNGHLGIALAVVAVAAILAAVVPGTPIERLLRAVSLLAGGGLVAITARLALRIARRPAPTALSAASRRGAAGTLTALGIAVLPVAVALLVGGIGILPYLPVAAAGALLAQTVLAGGAAVVRAGSWSAAWIGGATENDRAGDDPTGPAADAQAGSDALHSASRTSLVTALTLGVLAAAIATAPSAFGASGIAVALLGAGAAIIAALLAPLAATAVPAARERTGMRIAYLVAAVLALGGGAALTVLLVPHSYAELPFAEAGITEFLIGGAPLAVADLWPQLSAFASQLPELISTADQMIGGQEVVELTRLTLADPAVMAAGALVTGGLLALVAAAVIGHLVDPTHGAARAAARTGRTGPATGLLSGIASSVVAAALLLVAAAAALYAVFALSTGAMRAFGHLLALAGVGALVVVGALAAARGAEALRRESVAAAPAEVDAPVAVSALFAGLGAAALVTAAMPAPTIDPMTGTASGGATTLLADRLLGFTDLLGAGSLGGLVLGAATVLGILGAVLGGVRRAAATGVVAARTASDPDAVTGGGLDLLDTHAAARSVAAVAPLLLVAGALGAGAGFGVPGLLAWAIALTGLAVGFALVGSVVRATTDAAAGLVGSGRYGGPFSWAHTAGLNGALVGQGLGAAGSVLTPAALAAPMLGIVTAQGIAVLLPADGILWFRLGLLAIAAVLVAISVGLVSSAREPYLEDGQELEEDLLFVGAEPGPVAAEDRPVGGNLTGDPEDRRG